MTQKQRYVGLALLGVALCLFMVCMFMIATGYIPASGYSHNPHHELIAGLLSGVGAGLVMGSAAMLVAV